MTKKRVTTTLFIALVVLTLISCCFLGSTFARYVSDGKGSASTTVANWHIGIEGSGVGETAVTLGDLKPSADKYSNTPRSNTMKEVLVAAITNSGEVNATVTVTLGDMKIYGLEEDGITAAQTVVSDYGDNYSYGAVSDLFDLKLYYTTADSFSADNGITSGAAIGAALAPDQTYYIWAQVTWNSADENSDTDKGAAADALDTWVGENVGALGWTLSYLAEQAV